MATKVAVKPAKTVKTTKTGKTGEGAEGAEPATEERDSPLLDMSDAGVRKMIQRAKARGYVTYEELNEVLPSDQVSSEQIEDTMSMLSEMGINVVESEETEEDANKDGENLPAARDEEGGLQGEARSGQGRKSPIKGGRAWAKGKASAQKVRTCQARDWKVGQGSF